MPKIPTFTARTAPTTEVPTLRTGLQMSPTDTPAAALLPATQVVQNYFIKQRDNNEKLEADESDKDFEQSILDKIKNN